MIQARSVRGKLHSFLLVEQLRELLQDVGGNRQRRVWRGTVTLVKLRLDVGQADRHNRATRVWVPCLAADPLDSLTVCCEDECRDESRRADHAYSLWLFLVLETQRDLPFPVAQATLLRVVDDVVVLAPWLPEEHVLV